MKKRILAFILTMILLVSSLGSTAFASGTAETMETHGETVQETIVTETKATQTGTAEGETTESETAESETAESETAESETMETDAGTAETTETETIEAETDKTQTAESETQSESQTLESEEAVEELSASKEGAEAFVQRLYQTLLLREADPTGLSEWTALLTNHSQTGADIISGFIHSDEFKKANYSDNDYIDILYQAFFDRNSDPAGKEAWLKRLSQGFSRDYLCAGFLGSQEFIDLCGEYGIIPGKLTLSNPVDLNENVTLFVNRLYNMVLSRNPDPTGLSEWADALISQRNTAAQAVEGFFYSDELEKKNLDDSAYLDLLYTTLLDRGSDPVGKNDWLGVLDSGVSRTYLLYNFVASSEFGDICSEYGITRGTITLTEPRDINKHVTGYITKAFEGALGRKPSVTDLNNWAKDLNSHSVSARSFVEALIFSDECTAQTASHEDFIKRLYRTALMREPSPQDIANWTDTIAQASRNAVLDAIVNSNEFSQICSTYGLPRNLEGWNQSHNGWYYVQNGQVISGWKRINGTLYYLDPNNYNNRAVGWCYVDGLKYYFDNNGALVQNVDPIIGKQNKYLLKVNTATNVVSVYAQDGANGFIIPVKNMICSTGLPGTPTVKGTFTARRLGYWGELMGPVWGQYITQIYADYLFHSCWYYVNGNRRTLSVYEYSRLGNNASHGCVRLTVGDAKWIFDNCNGSTITVYSNGAMDNMFDKPPRPTAVRISGDYGYDPTDPYFQ